jgi:hypothetical protein
MGGSSVTSAGTLYARVSRTTVVPAVTVAAGREKLARSIGSEPTTGPAALVGTPCLPGFGKPPALSEAEGWDLARTHWLVLG